jgi:prepilin-type N-terminal cleavage/methylation domain-containing protein
MNKGLKAFTLIELLVAMLVSSAVISSSYFIYRTFAKNMIDYKGHLNNLTDAVVLNGILSHDMNTARSVKKNNSTDVAMDLGRKSVEYEWKDEVVLRRTGVACDTFRLVVKNVSLNFMNEAQAVSGGLVDELIFSSTAEGRELKFCFEKKYGSDILVESENKSNGRY